MLEKMLEVDIRPGGHSNNRVVHMRDQRNEKKKRLFFEAECDLPRPVNGGQNVPIFKKKGPLGYY